MMKPSSGRTTVTVTNRRRSMNGRPRLHQAVCTVAASVVLGVALSSCSSANDSLAQQAAAGDNKNYVAGDGSVTEYSTALRGAPIELDVPMMDGTQLTSADLQGKVAVLNFWYAACAPCRLEAPTLEALDQEFAPKGVVFKGVNLRDDAATGEAFERSFGITYPSVLDKSGTVLLAMSQYVPPQAVPTTLVIDKQGRVAARILGVAEKSTLRALLTDAIAEPE
ncbi:TlpA family protein disulfide reductase [Pseudarthrobacter sp. R1]|uniref:TlpA family protein disulfide reductase n=1 Tax=Pseudarthrobacter sp. R1 TaxID=2944934 RepID=UPI00210B7161|nr:TlpA disulfide reductase family protein [Pseudarthrobacter sp. R1]MCQ6271850.1 TlpA family protein disulfide reductase [Pseudarthrobacter sp. R1]